MKILALDLGKFKTVGCILDIESSGSSYVTIKTTHFAVYNLIERHKPDRVVFEVGTPAGWVHDIAVSCGVEVQVANVNHEAWRWRNVKRKTDRLDALKLAQLSSVNQLPLVHVPNRSIREHRALIGYRCKLVARRTAIKNMIRSILHRQGLTMASGAAGWTLRSLVFRGQYTILASLLYSSLTSVLSSSLTSFLTSLPGGRAFPGEPFGRASFPVCP